MAKPVNQKGPRNADKEQKQANREARNKKRAAALEAKMKARKEAEEKGLPWNDTIQAARFLEDYDAAFMSAVAGEPKVSEPVNPDVVAGVNQDPEADQTPVQTEIKVPSASELVKMAKAAVGRTTDEVANDNDEEIEPLSATGVDVVAKEDPVEDTPAEEAPVEDKSGPIPAINLEDPSTWPLESNGGLMRFPGESGKKFSNRKHKHKLWRREQAKLVETRNGDAPESRPLTAEEVAEFNSRNTAVAGTVPVEKSAAESAAVFEAAEMETVKDEPANETPDTEQAEPAGTDADTTTTDVPVAPTKEPLEEAGTSDVEETPHVEPSTATVEAKTGDEPKPTDVPEKKPTLTLASSQSEDAALAARAQKFYGDTWTAARAEKLTKAFKFLEMAIRLQQKGESDSRVNMPMTSAIRLETEALGIAVVTAKAA